MCKRKIHLVIVMALLIFTSKEGGADCAWGGAFLDNIERSDLIVQGKIMAYSEKSTLSPSFLKVEVLEVYRGTLENSLIQIGEDALFGAKLIEFPVGTEWILALKQGANGQYNIPGCWESYLKVELSVVGILNNTQTFMPTSRESMSFDQFKNLLNNSEDEVQAGRQQCIDDPISCGITTSRSEAWYHPTTSKYVTGRLYTPLINVQDVSGNITVYDVRLNQRWSSWVFDLDVNSIKAHQ